MTGITWPAAAVTLGVEGHAGLFDDGRGRPLVSRSNQAATPGNAAVPMFVAPPAGFEPARPAPEAGALSPELRGRLGLESRRFSRCGGSDAFTALAGSYPVK